MATIETESLVTITQAAKLIPGRPSTASVWRWAVRGTRDAKLESLKVGGKRFTSKEAVQRFLHACNSDSPTTDEAERELAADGI